MLFLPFHPVDEKKIIETNMLTMDSARLCWFLCAQLKSLMLVKTLQAQLGVSFLCEFNVFVGYRE